MKHHLNRNNPGLYSAIALRKAIIAAGLTHSCAIRKCRRDGGCTGPLVAGDIYTDPDLLVVDPARSPGEHIIPACMALCSESEIDDINRHVGAILQGLKETPEMPLVDPSRAIGARTWKTIGKNSR
ncbi:MAG: hypothetical protein JWM58_3019 [Rhizobium sp.]|nr:hypothetical protein [Rhizobium sp.]